MVLMTVLPVVLDGCENGYQTLTEYIENKVPVRIFRYMKEEVREAKNIQLRAS
jgi:hypothetical protein